MSAFEGITPLLTEDVAIVVCQQLPMEMSAVFSPLLPLVVIVKACMRCGSVVVVSNPVQGLNVYMWFIFYHM